MTDRFKIALCEFPESTNHGDVLTWFDSHISALAIALTLATESEQLRKERDGLKLENESLKDFVQIENIMHSMYKGECLELRKENEELKSKLDKAKDCIRFYASKDFTSDAVSLNRAQYDNGQRARTTLEWM